MAVNSQSRLKMITAQEWDWLWCYNHILSEPETTEEQSTCNMHITKRHTHPDTHTKEHILTCADILDRHNYKSITQW